MKISVIGLGFVGTVTAGCLCEMGHDVVGVDRDQGKVDLFARGCAPIVEPHIDQLLADVYRSGRLHGTADINAAIAETDLTFVCVGTLRNPDDSQDVSAVEAAIRSIGAAIAAKATFHSIVIRSTVIPGTTRSHLLRLLEHATGGNVGEKFGLANNPEFTREGSAVADFRTPSRVVIGEIDARTGDQLATIYAAIAAPLFRTSVEAAETIKYVDNSWHALKVVFANEIGSICEAAGVDSANLMSIFCADKVLNISPAYLQPGFAFGGPCLPKDVAVLNQWCRTNGLNLPVLAHIPNSNERVIADAVAQVIASGLTRIAIFGLTYKAGICDLRGSPFAEMATRLRDAGRTVRVFDPEISQGRQLKTRKDYTDRVFEGLDDLLVDDADALLESSDMIIFTTGSDLYLPARLKVSPRHTVLDLTAK